jgi:hypothetical protein
MTAQLLGTLATGEMSEHLRANIFQDDDGRVYFTACAAIDADGANGQHGRPAAYMADDSGTDALAAAGLAIDASGRVVCAHALAKDIVILGADGQPKVFETGMIASKTWYRHRDNDPRDPTAYVDAETVSYAVVPPLIVQRTQGVVRGCRARISWRGKSVEAVVADLGPHGKLGELSVAAARALNMPSSPRNGGVGKPEVLYELWPGLPAPGFELQPA